MKYSLNKRRWMSKQTFMKKLIFLAILTNICCFVNAQVTTHNLVFKPGQLALTQEQQEEIKKLALLMKNGENLTIYPLTGDDPEGTLVFAKTADLQAEEVVAFAKSQGFEVTGIAKNFPSAYRGRSVSVNLKFLKQENQVGHALKDRFPQKPSQYFVIDPRKDTIIVGKEGTVLYLPAGALMSQKPVRIEVKEYYSLSDNLTNGLQTSSNGKMIETGGTIYLDATEQGNPAKKVGINPDQGVGVDFTLGKNDPEMQVFIKDPKSTDKVNWILPRQKKIKETWEMTETIYDENGNIISEKKFDSKKEWEDYQKQQKEDENRMKKQEENKALTQNKMAGKLQVYDLGFINCDKFYDEPMQPLLVNADPKNEAVYYLVFTDVRGVMQGNAYGGKVNFGSVPKNKQAVLIAVAYVDDKPYFFKGAFTIGGQSPKVELQPSDENFVNQQLAALK